MSLHSGVPTSFDGQALDDHHNTCEDGKNRGDCQADPDRNDMKSVAHNSQQETTYGEFAHPDNHQTSHLAEQFILDGLVVGCWVSDRCIQLSKTISSRDTDEGGICDLKNLQHVSLLSICTAWLVNARDSPKRSPRYNRPGRRS